jgi:hypothetical protein
MAEALCPVCGQSMALLHEIRRAFAENLYVFECKPCGFSTTESASRTKTPEQHRLADTVMFGPSGVTSLTGLAAALNERGARTPAGSAHWYASQVAWLLKRPAE